MSLPVPNMFKRSPVWTGWSTHIRKFLRGMWHAFLATALFRCWHHILFFTAISVIVTYFNRKDPTFKVDASLVTVIGSFIGFIISLRTSASFDRYHEGRKYWSQLSLNAVQFSRCVWFYVPESKPVGDQTPEEARARTLIEKRTVINLIEAFAVAVKHHLRGENGVYYVDLYHLVKMLPAYAMESGVLSPVYAHGYASRRPFQAFPHPSDDASDNHAQDFTRVGTAHTVRSELPLPATASPNSDLKHRKRSNVSAASVGKVLDYPEEGGPDHLLPARNPPHSTIFDVWPLSMFVRLLQAGGRRIQGKKAHRVRAETLRYGSKTENVPMEISLYLSAYIRKQQAAALDGLILAQLLEHLKLLMDANVGLERIQTTPIPFSYSVHLWSITTLYLLLLPFQLASTLGWLTPAAVALAAFAYCGLLKAGDEIEQPFGYDYNDLNMDHFTKHVIRRELRALTAMPIQDPVEWIFSSENDRVLDDPLNSRLHPSAKTKRRHPGAHDHTAQLRRVPDAWVQAGESEILHALALTGGVSDKLPLSKFTKSVFTRPQVDADSGMLKAAQMADPRSQADVARAAASPGMQHVPTSMEIQVPHRSTSAAVTETISSS
ncbi:UPF0187-domain-containing protein [Auriculariales sp. MPI-PUGE-AT-0066]|nr:UPF0187-domain-containing protein [Auriculariales sp. MPI-PUGE-AT-0066]